MQYPDHHIFTIDDLKEIRTRFDEIESDNKIIITTEKDAVRLAKFDQMLNDLPLYVIPIRHRFLFDEGERFNEHVANFIKDFKPGIK
jgi:tetraacyldisaccharide 4'-kinase